MTVRSGAGRGRLGSGATARPPAISGSLAHVLEFGASLALGASLLLSLAACSREAQPPAGVCRAIGVGERQACAICEGEAAVRCWGGGRDDAAAPVLKSPRAVAAGIERTCAIDEAGAQCWGGDVKAVGASVPGAWEALANFDDQLCLLGNGTVQCPQAGGPPWSPPGLAHPRRIAGGNGRLCVLDDVGVRCWAASPGHAMLPAPVLANAIGIAAGDRSTCASDGRAIVCAATSGGAAPVTIRPSPAGAVRSLTMNAHDDLCALVDGNLQCWDRAGLARAGTPVRHDLTQVSAGDAQICVLGAEGRVSCWATGATPRPRRSALQPAAR